MRAARSLKKGRFVNMTYDTIEEALFFVSAAPLYEHTAVEEALGTPLNQRGVRG